MTVEELSDKLTQDAGCSLEAGTCRFASDEVTFSVNSGQVWMERGRSDVAQISLTDGEGFEVAASASLRIDSDTLDEEQRRQDAGERMDAEMWPAMKRFGFRITEEQWDSEYNTLLRFGETAVADYPQLLKLVQFLAKGYLSDAAQTELVE